MKLSLSLSLSVFFFFFFCMCILSVENLIYHSRNFKQIMPSNAGELSIFIYLFPFPFPYLKKGEGVDQFVAWA